MILHLLVFDDVEEGDGLPEIFRVDIDKEYAALLLERMNLVNALHAADDHVEEIVYNDLNGEWFLRDWDYDPDNIGDVPHDSNGEPIILLISEEQDDQEEGSVPEPVRTEIDRLHVYRDQIGWSCYMKHGDERLTTERVPRATLEQIAGVAPEKFLIRATDERDDETNEPLYWSNTDGWVDKASAARFTQHERDTVSLPIGGEWVEAGATIPAPAPEPQS
jgi:hypothetical protein